MAVAGNPPAGVKELCRRISVVRKPCFIQEKIELVDYLGVSRLIVSVFGSKRTTNLLGINEDIASRLRLAQPYVISKTALGFDGYLDLAGLNEICIPEIYEARVLIDVSRTRRLSLPNLVHIGGELCGDDSFSLDVPSLKKVGKAVSMQRAFGSTFPRLKEIGWNLRVEYSQNLTLPALERIGKSLEAYGSSGLYLPKIRAVAGTVELGCANLPDDTQKAIICLGNSFVH